MEYDIDLEDLIEGMDIILSSDTAYYASGDGVAALIDSYTGECYFIETLH